MRTIHYMENKSPNESRKFALLRKAAGKSWSNVPEIFSLLSRAFSDSEEEPSEDVENAVFNALTLYAWARMDGKNVQKSGVSIGTALGSLINSDHSNEDLVTHHMKSILASHDAARMAHEIRGLLPKITQNTGLDYGMLADFMAGIHSEERKQDLFNVASDFNTASHS